MDAENQRADAAETTAAAPYRLVILGGDPAAAVAAREAARRGIRVALTLPAGGESEPPRTPLAELLQSARARLASPRSTRAPDEPGIDVYRGQPFFYRKQTIAVAGSQLRFRHALIATGSIPAPLAITGADPEGCLTIDDIEKLTELPSRLAVIGTGPEACAWAQTFARLGTQVSMLGRVSTILMGIDPGAAAVVQARMEQDGIRMHLGCDELYIETTGRARAVVIDRAGDKEKLLVDRIVLCGPRRPNVEGLGLATAGVKHSDHRVLVDDRLRTANRRILAAGAVCGPEFGGPEAAETTARLAVDNALALRGRRLSSLVIPRCVRTQPAVVQLGLSSSEAAQKRIAVETFRQDLSEADASVSESRRQGFVAVHVERRTGRLAGATVAAEDADELAGPLLLLLARRLPLAALAEVIPCQLGRLALLVRLAQRHAEPRGRRACP